MTLTRLTSGRLKAAVSTHGAELQALETADGVPLLWHGDAAWWTGRSPLLFPIVGRVPDDEILVEGRRYPLKQHGFARTSAFTLLAASETRCSYGLTSSAETEAAYPFAFTLAVAYEVTGETLVVRATVSNREPTRPMPFSFGFHPAFLWPLRPGTRRTDCDLLFSHGETASIARPADGLLATARQPNPVGESRRLPLQDALFADGALIFDAVASDSITYRNGAGLSVRISFKGMPHLGIWSKPGAPFVCIEPWHGFAAPEGFAGELADKPGIILLPAGDSRSFEMSISIVS